MFKCIEDKGVGSSGYNRIKRYFDKIGYGMVFDWFYLRNEGKNNPYHNNTHTFNVVELIKRYCDSVGMSQDLTKCYLIAALFHDFNHSGGNADDDENINRACKGLTAMMCETKITSLLNKDVFMPSGLRALVYDLIYFTRYPYKKCINSAIRVLREADILSYEHTKWKKYVFHGLCEELGVDKSKRNENIEKLLSFHKKLLEDEIKTPFFKGFMNKNYKSFEKEVVKTIKNTKID